MIEIKTVPTEEPIKRIDLATTINNHAEVLKDIQHSNTPNHYVKVAEIEVMDQAFREKIINALSRENMDVVIYRDSGRAEYLDVIGVVPKE